MSKPPINLETSAAGIAVDPRTLERVIPESQRPDGSVRKQIKIRPGFTPQEDVKSFRTKRQTTIEANALPKGHIIGWVPPSSVSTSTKTASNTPLTKSAKKNMKRKKKREEVKANWEDDDDDVGDDGGGGEEGRTAVGNEANRPDKSNESATTSDSKGDAGTTDPNELSRKLGKLEVK